MRLEEIGKITKEASLTRLAIRHRVDVIDFGMPIPVFRTPRTNIRLTPISKTSRWMDLSCVLVARAKSESKLP